jgi:hypothetical protein
LWIVPLSTSLSQSAMWDSDNFGSGASFIKRHQSKELLLLVQTLPGLTERGCCAIRNATNGWDWTNNVTREQCLKDNRAVGGTVQDVYHYPREMCDLVSSGAAAQTLVRNRRVVRRYLEWSLFGASCGGSTPFWHTDAVGGRPLHHPPKSFPPG